MSLTPHECPNCGRFHEHHDFNINPGPIQQALQEFQVEHDSDPDADRNPVDVELDTTYEMLRTVRTELVDQAMSGNLERIHHLETAVSVFADVGVLIRAEEIIRELFDPRTDDPQPATGGS